MKLYTHPFSQHGRRVMMLAHELGIDLPTETVSLQDGAHKSDEFLKLNPAGAIPVLQDGMFNLPESHAIMKYLCSTSGGSDLYPQDAKARAHVDRWLDWNHTRLNPPIQTLFIQKMLMGDNADDAVIAKSESDAKAALHVLEHALSNKSGIGEETSLADLSIASTLALFEMAGGDFAGLPTTDRFYSRIKDRPSFAAAVPQMG